MRITENKSYCCVSNENFLVDRIGIGPRGGPGGTPLRGGLSRGDYGKLTRTNPLHCGAGDSSLSYPTNASLR